MCIRVGRFVNPDLLIGSLDQDITQYVKSVFACSEFFNFKYLLKAFERKINYIFPLQLFFYDFYRYEYVVLKNI